MQKSRILKWGVSSRGISILGPPIPQADIPQGAIVRSTATIKNTGSVTASFRLATFFYNKVAGGWQGGTPSGIITLDPGETSSPAVSYAGKVPDNHPLGLTDVRVEIVDAETGTISYDKSEGKINIVSVAPQYGYITVTSSPTSANIYLDDSYIGLSPIYNYAVTPGSRKVTCTKSGYKGRVWYFDIAAGESKSYNFVLEPEAPPPEPKASAILDGPKDFWGPDADGYYHLYWTYGSTNTGNVTFRSRMELWFLGAWRERITRTISPGDTYTIDSLKWKQKGSVTWTCKVFDADTGNLLSSKSKTVSVPS